MTNVYNPKLSFIQHLPCKTRAKDASKSKLLTNERLSTHYTLTHNRALIRSSMTFAYLGQEFAPDTILMTLQRLQNKVFRTIGIIARNTPARDMHNDFQIPYIYDYKTKLCRQQAQVIQTLKIHIFQILDKAKPNSENIRGLNLEAIKDMTVRVSNRSYF